jgi:hypothetical protein
MLHVCNTWSLRYPEGEPAQLFGPPVKLEATHPPICRRIIQLTDKLIFQTAEHILS